MSKKDSLNFEILKMLCDFNGEKYVQKRGINYIQSLGKIFPLNNKNDNPFTIEDIKKQPLLKDFKFLGVVDYQYICKLRIRPLTISKDGDRTNEKILAEEFASQEAERIFKKSLGVSYLLTCVIDGNEYIIKIGSTRTTFSKRLSSYNCGVVNNWRTASTTNIKLVQSMVTTRMPLNLYLFDCSDEPYVYTWHNTESVPFASPKALAVEDIMVKKFIEQFGFKPLANVQANATEIDE